MDKWLLLPLATKFGDVILLCGLLVFILFALWAFVRITGPKRIAFGKAEADFGGTGTSGRESARELPSLRHHRFFKLMESAKNSSFLVPDGGVLTAKDAINVAFLRDCKFKVFREGMIDFVTQLERREGDNIGAFPETINNLVERYEMMAHKLVIDLPDGSTICGVPTCYLRKFSAWHASHAQLALDGVSSVIADRIYPDWWTRAAAALEYLYMAFELTREDSARTLAQLNGDLDTEIADMLAKGDRCREA